MLEAEPIRSFSVANGFTEINGKRAVLVGDSVTQGWMELGKNYDWKAYLDALREI